MRIKFTLFLFIFNCISPRIYIPNSKINEDPGLPKKITVSSPNDYDIIWKPILLTHIIYDKKYNGRYGTIREIIDREFNWSSDYKNKKITHIEIEKFDIVVSDECKKNITSINVKFNVYQQKLKKPFYTYEKTDKIKSYVSDCSTLIYSLSIFGLLWYVPHVGVNGTREDQIEYLANSNLESFFKGLKNAK